ncbi:MAG TPA: bacillithiol system redox-active protein YtxJ [Pyrinomonadaceae bacterium]
MANKFLKLADQETLNRLMEDSKDHPVVVFKHSNSCGISAAAYREMAQLDNINLLEIQTARELSREVAAVTGVEHESPQVIILKDGKAVWNASHYAVKAGAVADAVEANR